MFCQILKKYTGVDFVKEFRFCDKRRFRFDFCNVEKKIAIEIEGGIFANGRHTRGTGYLKDMEKYNLAQEMGFKVFRYTPQQITKIETLEQIKRVL